MNKVADVRLVQHEEAKGPWVEVTFAYLNSNYLFRQCGPDAKMAFISGSKPGSEGRSPAPEPPKKVRAKMYEVAAAIARGRYMKLGLVATLAKAPKPETAPLFV